MGAWGGSVWLIVTHQIGNQKDLSQSLQSIGSVLVTGRELDITTLNGPDFQGTQANSPQNNGFLILVTFLHPLQSLPTHYFISLSPSLHDTIVTRCSQDIQGPLFCHWIIGTAFAPNQGHKLKGLQTYFYAHVIYFPTIEKPKESSVIINNK